MRRRDVDRRFGAVEIGLPSVRVREIRVRRQRERGDHFSDQRLEWRCLTLKSGRLTRREGPLANSLSQRLCGRRGLPYAFRRVFNDFQEVRVDPRIVGELRMERGSEHVSLTHHHAVPVPLGKQLDRGTDALDPRRANEDRRKRLRCRGRQSADRLRRSRSAGRMRCAAR